MFEGEKEGLKAICETKTILAPYPISTGHTNVSRHFLVMQYLNITKLTPVGWSKLGRRVANMHMFNLKIRSLVFIPIRYSFSNRVIFFTLNIDGAIA